MKYFLFILINLLFWQNLKASSHNLFDFGFQAKTEVDSFKDSRDNHIYETIEIDSMLWFNENLNYFTAGSFCYDNEPTNCQKLGRLYDFQEATQVCPNGWRLPTRQEYNNLLAYISNESSYSLIYLKGNWNNRQNLADFNITSSGFKHKRKYKSRKSLNFWISDSKKGTHAHMYQLNKKDKITLFSHNPEARKPILKKRNFSIRCVQNSKENGN